MTQTALRAVEVAFRALKSRDWKELFAVLDPAGVEQFKQRQRFMLAMNSEMDTTSPHPSGGMLRHVFAVETLAGFDSLPAALVLRRWLIVAHRGLPTMEPTRQVIGEVRESPELAHVVFRQYAINDAEDGERSLPAGLFDPEEGQVRVISVRKIEGAWRVGLAGGLIVNEDGGWGMGYNPGAVDPTAGEAEFLGG